MSRTERALLTLLRAGLWMKEPSHEGVFPLTEEEWAEVLRRSKEHTVGALVLQGVNMMNEDLMPPMSLLQRWAVNMDRIERENKKQNRVQGEVVKWLTSLGTRPKVLKGQGAAAMYEHPSQRACGDIDLFFPTPGDRERVWEAAKERGLEPKGMVYGAFCFEWDGVMVECHKRLLDISNPFCKGAIDSLIDREAKSDGIYPTAMTMLLLLNAHILKHMLSHGIGLRQFADMARAYHCLKGQYDETEYLDWCRRLHIEKWTRELERFLAETLGSRADDLPMSTSYHSATDVLNVNASAEDCTDLRAYIYNKVLRGGNFGFYGSTRASNDASRLTKRIHTIRAMANELKYSLRLAPQENLWMILQLAKGDR